MLGGLGRVLEAQGSIEEARSHLEQALAVAREVGDKHIEGETLGDLGLFYAKLNEPDQARSHLEAGCSILREIGSLDDLAKLLCSRGEYECRLNDLAAAGAALAEAESIAAAIETAPNSDLTRSISDLRASIGSTEA